MDSFASRRSLRSLAPRLRAAGVEVVGVLPLGFFRRKAARLDLRNHRKIAVWTAASATSARRTS